MHQLDPPCTRPYNVRTLGRGYMDGGLRLARSVGMAMRSAGPRGKALTIPQVCRELSVDRRTVYQLIESGALAAYRVGKDRKSTRLNSSHANISYAVFCLKNK